MAAASSAPLVWLLRTDKAGDMAQLRALARAAGLTPQEIQLGFNRFASVPNLLLGASIGSLNRAKSHVLAPPWPDLVLSSGRRSVPIARWIKRQSGGRTRLAHIGRPWGRLAWFDLVFAMPQYGLPARRNVFHARMPFNAIAPDAAHKSVALWRSRLADKPRPWIAVLLGGDARPVEFDAGIGDELGRRVAARARASGGTVLLSTSRRSAKDAVDATVAQVDRNSVIYRWRPDDPDNPYAAFLAMADEIVVTGDSASMLAEALRTGKPVSVMPLAVRPDARRRWVERLRRMMPSAWFELLVDLGVVASTRDLARLHHKLQAEGLIDVPGGDPGKRPPLIDDLPAAAARLRSLLDAR